MCQHLLVLLAYLDESYNTEKYFIGALVVHEDAARPLIAAIDDLVVKTAQAHPQLGLDPRMEIHAHELVNAKGPWRPMQHMLRARIALFEGVLTAIKQCDVQFIVEGIDRVRLAQRYPKPDHPHPLALMYVMERVNEHAQAVSRITGNDTITLLIADEVDQHDEHRKSLWRGQRYGTWGYKSQRLDSIVDTIYFAPSDSTRLLQAADVATFLYRRHWAHVETDPRARTEWRRLYDILEPQIARQRIWP